MNPHNLKVGQSLFVVPNDRRGNPYTITITGVRRKWAEFELYGRIRRIDLESLWLDGGDYSSPGRCYLSEDEYKREKERSDYWRNLYQKLCHQPPACSLETMKHVASLLGLGEKK